MINFPLSFIVYPVLLTFSQALLNSGVILVPYEKWHVPTYHEWMKDEVLHNTSVIYGTLTTITGDPRGHGVGASLIEGGICDATELEK